MVPSPAGTDSRRPLPLLLLHGSVWEVTGAWQMPEPETLSDLARMMHEYYHSLREQGFTPHEALHIILGQPCCEKTT